MVHTTCYKSQPNDCDNHALLVSKMIGSAYDVVKYVAMNMNSLVRVDKNMEELLVLSENLEQFINLYEHREEYEYLYEHREEFISIFNQLDALVAVGDNVDALVDVSANINGILQAAIDAVAAKDEAQIIVNEIRDIGSDAVSQGNVPIYASKVSVESLTIPSAITALRTNGYSAVGDGGGALYKRVAAEPSHTGKVQSADGAWWELAELIITPQMFGASGDGIADDSQAIQRALNALVGVGGTLRVPAGKYRVNSTVTLALTGLDSHAANKSVNIAGDGSGCTQILAGAGVEVLSIIGDVSGRCNINVEGLCFAAASGQTGVGLKLDNIHSSYFHDLLFMSLEYGTITDDFIVSTFSKCRWTGNKYHLRMNGNQGSYSTNAVTFNQCIFHNATEHGIWINEGGLISFFGGNIEGNGRFGTSGSRWGLRIDDAGRASTKGLCIYGVYFESNEPCDVRIHQGQYETTHTIRDCDFHRNNMVHYATNNILVSRRADTSALGKLILSGNSFGHFDTYVPDAGRRYVNSTASNFNILDDGTNHYESPVEAPTAIFSPMVPGARVTFNGAAASPVTAKMFNVTGVSKVGTGVYDIVLTETPKTPDTSTINCSVHVNGQGIGYFQSYTAATRTVRIRTDDLSGTSTDFSRVTVEVFI